MPLFLLIWNPWNHRYHEGNYSGRSYLPRRKNAGDESREDKIAILWKPE